MSSTSQITSEYRNLADVSERVNHAIVVLKKQRALSGKNAEQLYPGLFIPPHEIQDARASLVDFLRQLLAEVKKTDNGNAAARHLRGKHITERILNKLIQTLQSNAVPSEEQLSTLDAILFTVDDERSALYRTLRTARRE